MRMRTVGRPARMRNTGLVRPSSPSAFKVVAVAAVIAAAGVSAGSAAAAGQQAVSLRLAYTCAFPSASRPVSALVTATFPAAGTTGQPIRPTGTQITVTLPRAALASLARPAVAPSRVGPPTVARPKAVAVTLTASLTTDATRGTRSVTVPWRHFRSPATALPRHGLLALTASGAAAPVTASSPGRVTVSAAGLSLLFTTAKVNGGPAVRSGTPNSSSGTPGRPAGIQAVCMPRAGQDTTLAKIVVAGSAPAKRAGRPAAKPRFCQPFIAGTKLNPRFPLPKPPPGSRAFRLPQPACSNAAGYTNARKLKEAALVGPGLTDLRLGVVSYTNFNHGYSYFQQNVAARLEYHGRAVLPPARATFLAFGFTPVSATLQVSEVGSLNAALISCAPAPKACPNNPPNIALFFGFVSLRVSNVDINGVPLNVGPHCQTVTPFNLELVGLPPTYNISAINGILTGTINVPLFKGCANGSDNLDPIFNASVSGPGNFVKINQAPFCAPTTTGHPGCPPVPAKPVH
jgi:hypothetical protein